jgi:hypothetical protein
VVEDLPVTIPGANGETEEIVSEAKPSISVAAGSTGEEGRGRGEGLATRGASPRRAATQMLG